MSANSSTGHGLPIYAPSYTLGKEIPAPTLLDRVDINEKALHRLNENIAQLQQRLNPALRQVSCGSSAESSQSSDGDSPLAHALAMQNALIATAQTAISQILSLLDV